MIASWLDSAAGVVGTPFRSKYAGVPTTNRGLSARRRAVIVEVREVPHAQCEIDSAFQEIHVAIVEQELEVEIRVVIHELGEMRDQVEPCKRHRRGHAKPPSQASARGSCGEIGLVRLVDRAPRVAKELLALAGG